MANAISTNDLSKISDLIDTQYDDREIKRGEIYYIDLQDIPSLTTHISNRRRPALIIQNDVGNQRSTTVIIALITSTPKKVYPFHFTFSLNGKQSTIMFEQIMTIDKYRIEEKIYELTYNQLKQADEKLMFSLQLSRLTLANVGNIEVVSVISKKSRTGESVYFEIKITFVNYTTHIINVTLEKLKQFNNKITKDIDFDDLCKMLDCCKGLNWLVNNNEV